MNPVAFIPTAVITLWICAAMEQSLATRLGFWGVRPDFLLVALTVLSLYTSKRGGIVLGFFAGLLHGGIAGANMMHYIISRTLGGYAAATTRNPKFEPKLATVAATVAGITVFSQIVLMFFAPPDGIARFLGATILSALYNGVLSLPLHALMKRILKPTYR